MTDKTFFELREEFKTHIPSYLSGSADEIVAMVSDLRRIVSMQGGLLQHSALIRLQARYTSRIGMLRQQLHLTLQDEAAIGTAEVNPELPVITNAQLGAWVDLRRPHRGEYKGMYAAIAEGYDKALNDLVTAFSLTQTPDETPTKE